MNRLEMTAQPQHGGSSRRRQKIGIYVIVVSALVCILLVVILLFIRSYGSLRAAIQQERIDYVGEISTQLISGHRFMLDEYSSSVLRFAGIVDRSRASSLEDIADCFIPDDAHRIMLISEAGGIIDLSGKNYFTADREIVEELSRNVGVTQLFASLNNEMDFWLFATAIEPLRIGEQSYRTIVLAVPADRFGETLAISLFGNRGASYIIKSGGSIDMKPDDSSVAFGGYNLFSSLAQSGVPEQQIAELRTAIGEQRSGSMLLEMHGQEWLFGYNSIDDKNAFVVAVPLTLTAAKTYQGLSGTIMLSGLSIIVIALIALIMILSFFHRDREREKQALAVAAKSDFYSKMSHDIRTPLNAVIGLVQLAKDDADKPEVKAYLSQSLTSANYLLGIINDVLEMSRIESGNLSINESSFDMNALLHEVKAVAAPLFTEKGLIFIDEANERFETEYFGDQMRIKQILMNLLSNATKFTRPGGQVGLHVTSDSQPEGWDELTMIVSDTGIGMSEAFLERVFVPFEQEQSSYTQQYAGSGLGLAIVHDLVARMGGAVEVVSKMGEGTVFTVKLPLRRGEALARSAQPQKRKLLRFDGRRILLAEDNPVNQIVVAKLLSSKFGVETESAPDGEIALSMFAGSPPGSYDMILMDIKMPNMDGLEAARAIRALPRPDALTIPIVALSANTYQEDVELSLAAGMNGHLSKPLDIEAIGEVFCRYFLERP